MGDDEHADKVYVAAWRTLVEVSTEGVSPHIHNILSCLEWGHVFKWAFVDQPVSEKHHIGRCRAACKCGTSTGLTQLHEKDDWGT
jgi:hypothetical protein